MAKNYSPTQADRVRYNQWVKRQMGAGVDPAKIPDMAKWVKRQPLKKDKESGACFIGTAR